MTWKQNDSEQWSHEPVPLWPPQAAEGVVSLSEPCEGGAWVPSQVFQLKLYRKHFHFLFSLGNIQIGKGISLLGG